MLQQDINYLETILNYNPNIIDYIVISLFLEKNYKSAFASTKQQLLLVTENLSEEKDKN